MNLDSSVQTFFRTYEAATASQDFAALSALYAESFVFADPTRATAVKREDFAKAIPARQSFFSSIGLEATRLEACDAQPLADGYCLALVTWTVLFRKDGREIDSKNKASYVLRQQLDNWEIVFQLDHQNLAQRATELGLG